ncbi:MAG: sigma-70 family RNA polymerase sigma factor [Methanolobus sp.]|nr:sigma-70 family RNA polymerase sigma factor [Methanolobus sp.]
MKIRSRDIQPEFIAALQRQDAKAFEKFFDSYSGLVYSIAYSSLSDRMLAEDILQEVFLKAYHALPSFHGVKLSSWLGRITHNACIDLLRQQKKAPAVVAKPLEELQVAATEQTSCELPDILNLLTPMEKEVVVLKKVEGLSYAEISEITGLAEGSLRNMLVKVIRSLKGVAGEQGL